MIRTCLLTPTENQLPVSFAKVCLAFSLHSHPQKYVMLVGIHADCEQLCRRTAHFCCPCQWTSVTHQF